MAGGHQKTPKSEWLFEGTTVTATFVFDIRSFCWKRNKAGLFTSRSRYRLAGSQTPSAPPLTTHALRFDGRKHFNAASEMMAKITAAHLLRCLRESGFMVMKRPPAPAHPAPDCLKHLKE